MMNDRFRFRAWNKEYKQLHYDAEDTYDCLNGKPYPIAASYFGCLLYNEDWIVEQCTGLKDKNGKLIYEGDILEVSEAYENGIYKLEFCQSDCEYNLYNNDGCFVYELTKSFSKFVKIIGNIHENGDLLEK